MAAPATGRGGTNALYLSPPDAVDMHFGHDSLRKFERDAARMPVPPSAEVFTALRRRLGL